MSPQMSLALQAVLVGLVVTASLVYSAWRLASLKVRMRVIEALGTLPPVLTAPWLAGLRQRTLAQLAGGCAGCAAGGMVTPGATARPNRTPDALHR